MPFKTSTYRAQLAGLAIALASFGLATAISVCQWRTLSTPSWDLGIFTQLADAYAHLRAPIVPIKGDGFNLLGDHFHPILFLLGPIYQLFPSALTLLVVQNALFALAAGLFTTRLARLVPLWAASGLGIVLGLGWPTQTAVASQFHEIAFAVPLLALALTAYLAERPVAAAAWMAGLVFVKEDLGITVALFGAIMLARTYLPVRYLGGDAASMPGALRTQLRRAGVFLVGWGALWFLLTITVLLPALNPAGRYDYTGRIDGGGVLDVLLPASKWLLVGLLILTAGAIGLASPLFLLILPTLAWRFVGNVEFYWWIGWHYDVILAPMLLAAIVDAARRYGMSEDGSFGQATRRLLAFGTVLALASSLVVFKELPLKRLASCSAETRVADTTTGSRLETAGRVADLIAAAPGTSNPTETPGKPDVVSDLTLMARLVPVARVYWVAERGISPDFVVLDAHSSRFSRAVTDVAEWAERTYGGRYETVLDRDGLRVAQRQP